MQKRFRENKGVPAGTGKKPEGRAGTGRRLWKRAARAAEFLTLCLLLAVSAQMWVCASAQASQITAGISKLQNIVASFVSSVGSIIVLWGLFEWGNAMQSQDGMMQSQAFKRIGGGIVMTMGPQLLTLILS